MFNIAIIRFVTLYPIYNVHCFYISLLELDGGLTLQGFWLSVLPSMYRNKTMKVAQIMRKRLCQCI